MSNALSKNPLLTFSIALPVLVVVLFTAATGLPRLLNDPPAHDLLLAWQNQAGPRQVPVRINLGVENNRLVARASALRDYEQGFLPRILRYDHDGGGVRELDLSWPTDFSALEDGEVIPLAELENTRVSAALQAPDGYTFRGRAGRGGLMMEVFGVSRSRRDLSIAKGGAVHRIEVPDNGYPWQGAGFLGWVVDEDVGR